MGESDDEFVQRVRGGIVLGNGGTVEVEHFGNHHHRHRAPPRPSNLGRCHVNFAEGYHLYIRVTT
jgi:hypothetical protein